jgi:hypothetical protein
VAIDAELDLAVELRGAALPDAGMAALDVGAGRRSVRRTEVAVLVKPASSRYTFPRSRYMLNAFGDRPKLRFLIIVSNFNRLKKIEAIVIT